VSDLAQALVLIGVGLALVYRGGVELLGWLRGRTRLRSTTGVVVGHVSPPAAGPNNPSRSARIQFTADDGRVVEVVSSAWSSPGPRVGEQVPVRYDPADPAGTADRSGVQGVKVLLSPVLVLLGVGLAVFGLTMI
jgi:hypothetical protein